MRLTSRTEAVLRVYRRLDLHLRTFQSLSGLRCPPGCGVCCLSDSVEATVLELFPAAAILDETRALLPTLELLRSAEAPEHCLFHSREPDRTYGGHCCMYPSRPLMCRLFGFSARLDREGRRELAGCSRVREHLPEESQAAREAVRTASIPVPVMRNYAMEIFGIDPSLGSRLYPINEALARALEIRAFDSHYRRKVG
jgi:Fe-S-cluster containining protein